MDELRELLTLKGRVISVIEYVKRESFIDKNMILAILGAEEGDDGTD